MHAKYFLTLAPRDVLGRPSILNEYHNQLYTGDALLSSLRTNRNEPTCVRIGKGWSSDIHGASVIETFLHSAEGSLEVPGDLVVCSSLHNWEED
ncbi:hypothetical protein Y1Q_0018665 [Alligator mississippiensis]|uniref:Uncharacterized protein n=1 Tax=Alligator mississippiensis TaxID=8496 RepID=A0A151NS26_ALLMI|nr:hypothetical protein Y1Q_0018665 [Alligator mississippiensis]